MSTRSSNNFDRGAAGNLSRRDEQTINRDKGGPQITATTISFTAPATIADSGSGLKFAVGDMIEVRGSAKNSRQWSVTAASSSSLTVLPAMVQSEIAGPSITIIRGDST